MASSDSEDEIYDENDFEEIFDTSHIDGELEGDDFDDFTDNDDLEVEQNNPGSASTSATSTPKRSHSDAEDDLTISLLVSEKLFEVLPCGTKGRSWFFFDKTSGRVVDTVTWE